jgi:beta-galactosidase
MNFKVFVSFLLIYIFISSINAEKKLNFDLGWKFLQADVKGAEELSFNDKSWRTLNLPHDWSIEGEYKQTENGTDWQSGYLPAGIGWYRKSFDFKADWKGKKVQVLFDGAYLNSTVWINGHLLGNRPNGYISFFYDLTPFLKKNNNIISVKIDHGKPLTGRWYTGSGLYRSVSLLVSNKTHIEPWGVYFTTPNVTKEKSEVQVEVTFQNPSKSSLEVSAKLIDNKGKTVVTVEQATTKGANLIKLQTVVTNPKLWSVDTPNVYTLVCTLKENGKIVDETSQIVGIRKLTFSCSEGFKLNDIAFKLKGVCDHHTAGAVGAAIPDDVLYRKLKLLKNMGCNAIRTAHNPFSPTFYTMCDTMGIMVMNEAWDGWEHAKAENDYGNFFNQWWERDLTDFIKRDRNHPSVIIWSIGNEVEKATPATQKKLVDLIHTLDATRPVTQGGTDPTRGMAVDYAKNFQYLDIVGFNGNGEEVGEFEKFQEMNLNRCAVGTEVPHTYQTRGVYWSKTTWRRRDFPAPWELSSKISWEKFKNRVFEIPDLSENEVFPEEIENKYYQSSYDNASVRISARHSWQRSTSFPFLMGEFRWGSFDYLGEAEWPQRCGNFGIIDICGFPKDHYYLYQSLWSDKPMVHLLPHWTHTGKEGVVIPVVVYTNCQSAELFLNGNSLGKKHYVGEQLVWQVPYQAGELKVIAYNNNQIAAEKTFKSAGKPSTFTVTTDKKIIRANQKDIIHVEIDIADKDGNFCPLASDLINVEVTGAAKLLAMDNGDPIELSRYQINSKKAFRGKCLLILQATDKKGAINVTLKAKGLEPKTIHFESN